jgi:tRNA (adenine22-N1)-methyltransferase
MISRRLQTIASFIPEAKTIADIGTDHGYLIIEAFQNCSITKAYAIDNKEFPLNNAKKNIENYPFYKDVNFLISDGLSELKDEVDAIIISGMGGILIKDILINGINNHKKSKLILQANRNCYDLRKYLSDNSYKIIDEAVLKDEKKFYEIIVANHSDEFVSYTEADLLFGPILRRKKSKEFIEKLKDDLRILNKIENKNDEILNKIDKIMECL